MCYEEENNCNSIGTKHNSLSLNQLIGNNFDINHDLKDEIHELMSKSPYLWKTRPLPYKLNYYAGCDVFYLPKIYDLIVQKFDKKVLKKITLNDIFKECEKYLEYLNINKNIKNYNKMNLSKGTKIKGLIKNFQHHCVYIQLNIGYIGIVDNFPSVQLLTEKYKLGDIVDFIIVDIENKRKRMMLDIDKKQNKIREKEEKTDINKNDSNLNNINIELNNNIDTNSLVQEINIYKDRFYPKSYINNQKNSFPYNNFSNNYQNKNYDNNIAENYFKENESKKNYNNNNMNNEILNNNYNGLFYNDKENYYYYNKSSNNNEENDDINSDSYYYTLKPFPK